MINLLPPEEKHNLRAARSNTRLLNYNFALLVALAAMIGAFVVAYFYLTISQDTAKNSIAENRAKASTYSAVRQEAEEFRKNLATAKQILGNQVNYSSLILEISRSVPPNVVLSSIQLDAAAFGKPTSMTAQAKSVSDALELKERFTANKDIFSDVNIQNITTAEGQPGYPYTVTLNLTINKAAIL